MEGAEIDRLAARLWGDGLDGIYAVLDGARDPRIHPRVVASGLPHRCLFSGSLGAELTQAAPYLIRLNRHADFTRMLLRLGWGRSWGVFLASAAPLEELRRHLRRFVRVQDPRGKRLLFRYYDPRVLRVFLPSCDEGELQGIFGPVARYLVEGQDPSQLLVYRRAGAAISIERVDWADPGSGARA